MRVRTQIYLDPEQHVALLEKARRLNVSLAELIRQLVDRYLKTEQQELPTREDLMGLVGLGASGRRDIAEKHDQYLAEAWRNE